jgi:hypothetical protein
MSFDEMYDEMLHDEFRGGSAPKVSKRASGLARYRTAALVSAGGLAAATAGAFLGGLGGYFTVSPASGSPLTSTSTEVPLAAAAQAAAVQAASVAPAAAKAAAGASGTVTSVTNDAPGGAVATFAAAAGPLLNGVAPITAPSSSTDNGAGDGTTAPVTSGTTTSGNQGGSGLGQAGQILSLSLNEILGNLTAAINDIVTLPQNPTGSLTGLITPLTGVLTDVTGTLMDLSSLMPLPTSLGTLPVVSALAPALSGAPSAGPSHTTAAPAKSGGPSTAATALAPVLNSVAATVGSLTGGNVPTIPSLPLPSTSGLLPTVPSLPVTTTNGTKPSLPVIAVPGIPVTVPVPVPTVTSTAGSTCVSVPTPSLPVNIALPPIKVGPISVGVKTSGSSTGATVCG